MTDFENDPAEPRRTAMYKITGALTSSYDNMADVMGRAGFTKEEADYYEHQAREAAHINLYIKQKSGDLFDPRNYDPDMRAMLDRYLRAEDAETIVPATADFSFLDLINDKSNPDDVIEKTTKEANGSQKAAAEVIEAKARAVINNSKDKDPAMFLTFSERLQELLDGLHNTTVSFAERMKQMIELIKQAKNGGHSFPEGISTPRQKAYWNNRYECGFSEDETEALVQEEEVEYIVTNKARPNFRDPAHPHGILLQKELKKAFPNQTEEQIQAIYKIAVKN
jgi:type I restriction enzyme R subunit